MPGTNLQEHTTTTAAPPRIAQAANTVTTVRTVGAVAVAIGAIATRDPVLAVTAYLIYWVGDMLDGWTARRLNQETRFGAVFDILADRLCCILCIIPLLQARPQMAAPIAVFLLQFVVVDLVLSLSFLRFGLLSPNYFFRVHRGVFQWNWSLPAKAANTSALVLLVFFVPSPWPALTLALAVTAIKIASLVVVRRLPDSRPPQRGQAPGHGWSPSA
ncbi:CDP-alcohol phosphatidyltransferase family protein [Salinispora fenicalii]|uniref:CDP-alcohol phosphatidyltransferase family protein n=1 Tax=Salinispora fenicalii TaxID=1137263 RepID=UPI00048331F3|nr:CDP-alcohol phosphatidyltransferase family protein [Salinispora fenicalii]